MRNADKYIQNLIFMQHQLGYLRYAMNMCLLEILGVYMLQDKVHSNGHHIKTS